MNKYKYEVEPGAIGGYRFTVWTPNGIVLNYPINFIPFSLKPGPVAKGYIFSGTTHTQGRAMTAVHTLVDAHKKYGFKKVDANGLVASGTL